MIVANNPSDFDEDDIWVTGITKETAEAELSKVIKERWPDLDANTKDFYDDDIENYVLAWKHNWAMSKVAQ
jgi:hypothetical protein